MSNRRIHIDAALAAHISAQAQRDQLSHLFSETLTDVYLKLDQALDPWQAKSLRKDAKALIRVANLLLDPPAGALVEHIAITNLEERLLDRPMERRQGQSVPPMEWERGTFSTTTSTTSTTTSHAPDAAMEPGQGQSPAMPGLAPEPPQTRQQRIAEMKRRQGQSPTDDWCTLTSKQEKLAEKERRQGTESDRHAANTPLRQAGPYPTDRWHVAEVTAYLNPYLDPLFLATSEQPVTGQDECFSAELRATGTRHSAQAALRPYRPSAAPTEQPSFLSSAWKPEDDVPLSLSEQFPSALDRRRFGRKLAKFLARKNDPYTTSLTAAERDLLRAMDGWQAPSTPPGFE